MIHRRGLTLVELLVVIAIIGLLVAMLLPAVQSVRESARRTQCSNNLKQLIKGLHSHASSHGAFPAGTTLAGVKPSAASNWCQGGSPSGFPWTVAVLPFIEQRNVFDRFDLGLEFMQSTFALPTNQNGQNVIPLAVLQCPSSLLLANQLRNNYFGVQGAAPASCTDNPTPSGSRRFYINGVLHANSRVTFGHIRDGASNVLAIGETNMCALSLNTGGGRVEFFNWAIGGKTGSGAIPLQLAGVELPLKSWSYSPSSSVILSQGTQGFGSDHAGGCFFALADGSVQFIAESVPLDVLRLLAGRRDGGLSSDAMP